MSSRAEDIPTAGYSELGSTHGLERHHNQSKLHHQPGEISAALLRMTIELLMEGNPSTSDTSSRAASGTICRKEGTISNASRIPAMVLKSLRSRLSFDQVLLTSFSAFRFSALEDFQFPNFPISRWTGILNCSADGRSN